MIRRIATVLASGLLIAALFAGGARPTIASGDASADLTEGVGIALWTYLDEPGSGTIGWSTNQTGYDGWSLPAHTGSTYFAYGDQVNPSAGVLYRTFTLPDAGPVEISFAYYLNDDCFVGLDVQSTMSYSAPAFNQQFRVDLLSEVPSDWFGAPSEHLLENILEPTVEGPSDGWNEVTFDASDFAGETVVLAFREVDNCNPLDVAIDDIEVSGYAADSCALPASVCPTIAASGTTQVTGAPGTGYTTAYATYTWYRCGQPGPAVMSARPPVTCRKISSYRGSAAQMALRPYTITRQDVRAGYLRLAVKVLNTTYYSGAYSTAP